MLEVDQESFFEAVLFESLGEEVAVRSFRVMAGGCINNTIQLQTAAGNYFIKYHEVLAYQDMFEAEAKGLEILRRNGRLVIPKVLGCGKILSKSYLLLEYIDEGRMASDYWQDLGTSLAQLHSNTQENFGLDHHNYIGRLPQSNDEYSTWAEFFVDRRLEVQIGLARYNDLISESFARKVRNIYPCLGQLFPKEKPALLHGDLWSGNVIVGGNGYACLIDPAVYFGSREAELAFTKLFGGFDPAFYFSYQEAFPLEPGFEEREEIYNLYPLLVHANLFGPSYLSAVERVVDRHQ